MKKQEIDYKEDLDHINFDNYKGCFYNKETEQKYFDELTGAHFNYFDMCLKLNQLKKQPEQENKLKKPRPSVDSQLKTKEKIDKDTKPVNELQKVLQKRIGKNNSRNLQKQKTEVAKDRQIGTYYKLAARLQTKLAGQITDRNKSKMKIYELKITKAEVKTKRSLRYEALFGM